MKTKVDTSLKNYVDFPETLTSDQWLDAGKKLFTAQQNIQWLIGDWVLYGREKGWIKNGRSNKSKMLEEVVEVTGKSESTLSKYAKVAKVFDKTRRYRQVLDGKMLSYASYYEIGQSVTDPKKASEYADRAAKNGWSDKEVRKQIKYDKIMEKDGMVKGQILADKGLLDLIAKTARAFNAKDPKDISRLISSVRKRRILKELSELEEREVNYINNVLSGENKLNIF